MPLSPAVLELGPDDPRGAAATLADPAAPLLVDADALGRMIDLSTRSVRRLNSAGKIPRPVRVGGAVKWRVEDIRAWVGLGCPARAEFERLLASTQKETPRRR